MVTEPDRHQLREADARPLPLASDVHWTPEGWEVEIGIILETTGGGYSSSLREALA